MLNSIKNFFSAPIFEDDEEKTRSAELLNTILVNGYLLVLLILIAFIIGNAIMAMVIPVVILFFLFFFIHIILKLGYLKPATYSLITIVTIILTAAIAAGGTIRVSSLSFYILLSIISGVIISRNAMYVTSTLNTLIVFALLWAENTGKLPAPTYTPSAQPAIIFAAASLLAAIVLNLAIKKLNEALKNAQHETELAQKNLGLEIELEQRASALAERASYLETSAEISRSIASVTDTNILISKIVQLIQEKFNLYYVGLFLVDEANKWAILKSGTGEAGKEMLKAKHRLKIGSGMIGWSIENAQSRIALDVGEDAVHFENPYLPKTRSEGAIPLRSRGRVLGALTIQSTQPVAFTNEIITTLQIMTDQVAIALDNAMLFEKSELALEAERKAYGQLRQEDWVTLLQNKKLPKYTADSLDKVHISKEAIINETPQEHLILEDNGYTAIVPIKMRGTILGGIKLHKSPKRGVWTKSQLELAETLSEEISVALESARLFDQSQRRVAREHIIGQTATRLRETLEIEGVLKIAAQELRNALKISEAEVWLNANERQSTEEKE